MRIPISEARRRLPELVRQIRNDGGVRVQITVRDEVVAELRAVLPEPEPGAAARKLVEIMARLPKHKGKRTAVASRFKNYLYGRGMAKR